MELSARGKPGDPAFDSLRQRLDHGYELAVIGELDAAEMHLRAVLDEAAQAGFHNIEARSLIFLGYVSDQRGTFVLSQQLMQRCLQLCEAEGNHGDAAAAHFGMARCHMMLGQLDEAEAQLGQSLMQAKLSRRPLREADVYMLLGDCRRRRGLLSDAFDYLSSAGEIFEEHGEQLMLQFSLLQLHEVAFELGRDSEAEAAFVKAEGLVSSPALERTISAAYARKAAMLIRLGRMQEAEASLEKCASYFEARHDYEEELEIELARGMQAVATGRVGEALERYARSKRLAQRMHNRFRLGEIRLEHAKALIAYGRLEHAQAVLLDTELAFELFTAKALLARCQCCWAEYFLQLGNLDAAASSLARARQYANELGSEAGRVLAWELEQVGGVLTARQAEHAAKQSDPG